MTLEVANAPNASIALVAPNALSAPIPRNALISSIDIAPEVCP